MNAVIFDLDGLLVDSEIISYRIYQELLTPFGISFSLDDYAENCSGKTGIKNMEYLIGEYRLPLDVKTGLEKALSVENRLLSRGVELKPGAVELLKYLKENRYKIAMASSSTEERAVNMLEQHNIRRYFDGFVFGHEVERGKPSPDIFLRACEKIEEAPESCLVLEDSEAGIQAAYSAKIPVICIPDMKRPGPRYIEMTTLVLDSLQGVIAYLQGEG